MWRWEIKGWYSFISKYTAQMTFTIESGRSSFCLIKTVVVEVVLMPHQFGTLNHMENVSLWKLGFHCSYYVVIHYLILHTSDCTRMKIILMQVAIRRLVPMSWPAGIKAVPYNLCILLSLYLDLDHVIVRNLIMTVNYLHTCFGDGCELCSGMDLICLILHLTQNVTSRNYM